MTRPDVAYEVVVKRDAEDSQAIKFIEGSNYISFTPTFAQLDKDDEKNHSYPISIVDDVKTPELSFPRGDLQDPSGPLVLLPLFC